MQRFLLVSLLFIACAATVTSAQNAPYRCVGYFNTSQPAFLTLLPLPESGPLCLFISSFTGNPFASGGIAIVNDVAAYFDTPSKITPKALDGKFNWPNIVTPVPDEAATELGIQESVLYGDGFLVPGKDNGGIYLRQLAADLADQLSPSDSDNSGYFYHTGVWVDINNDGRLDVLTARAKKPFFGSGSGQLVWLEQPINGLSSLPWELHVLVDGPDFLFTVADLDGVDTTLEVLTAEYFSGQLTLNIIDLQQGTVVFHRVLDDQLGPGFGVSVANLTGIVSGQRHLLVTNHESDASKTAMFAYEIPTDFRNGTYNKHVLASGFPVKIPGPGQASPGMAYAVYPKVHPQTSDEKPLIVLAGDAAESLYLFTPTGNLTYSEESILDADGTVGGAAFADVNGDGYLDFFVADYDRNSVWVFTFAPENSAPVSVATKTEIKVE